MNRVGANMGIIVLAGVLLAGIGVELALEVASRDDHTVRLVSSAGFVWVEQSSSNADLRLDAEVVLTNNDGKAVSTTSDDPQWAPPTSVLASIDGDEYACRLYVWEDDWLEYKCLHGRRY